MKLVSDIAALIKIYKNFILLFICFLSSTATYSQFDYLKNDKVKFSLDVKIIDSDYLFIPKLEVIKRGAKIFLADGLYYSESNDPMADCKLYLQKLVNGKMYINLTTGTLRHPLYYDSMRVNEYSYVKSFSDTVNLGNYYPFESGQYRLMVELQYIENKIKKNITSNWADFEVKFLPKNSIFN